LVKRPKAKKIADIVFYDHLSARIFNTYPKKGAILPRSDADIIIQSSNSSFEISAKSHHSRLDWTQFLLRS